MISTPTKTANLSRNAIEFDQFCFVCGCGISTQDVYFLLKNRDFVLPLLKRLCKWKSSIFHSDETKLCKKCKDSLESIIRMEATLNEKKENIRKDFEKTWSCQNNFGSPLRLKRLIVSPDKISKKATRPLINPIQILTAPPPPQTMLTAPLPNISRIVKSAVTVPRIKMLPSIHALLPTRSTSVKIMNVTNGSETSYLPTLHTPPTTSSSVEERHTSDDQANGTLKITVQFPKCAKSYKLDDTDTIGIVVKSFAMKSIASGIKTLISSNETRGILITELIKFMMVEIQKYNTMKNTTLRHNDQNAIMNVNIKNLDEESSKICPLITSFAGALFNRDQNLTSFFMAQLLHAHNRLLSSFAYKFGYFLRWSGLRSTAMSVLSRFGLTVHGRSLTRKIEEMGADFDQQVIAWKIARDRFLADTRILKFLRRFFSNDETKSIETKSVMLLVKLLCREIQIDGINDELASKSLPVFNESTLTMASEFTSQLRSEKFTLSKLDEFCDDYISENENKPIHETLENITVKPCPSFSLVGDNCDMHISTRQKSSNNPNKSFHWFHSIAFLDPVSGDHLPKVHTTRLKDVPIRDFLPSSDDHSMLNRDFILLCTKIIVQNVPALEAFSDCVFWHIPHKYTKELSAKTVEVPLGIIPRNENSTEEMIEIVEELSEKYGLDDEDEFIFQGGDQVTEDRGRHCQAARCEEESRKDRLEKFWFKNEDWHFERIAYKCVLDKLSSRSCAGDAGTFYSNAVKLGNSNVVTDIMGSHYNKIKEFFQVHTSAMVVVAFTEYLGMESVNDDIEILENVSSTSSTAERRRWLFGLINGMLKKFVIPDIGELSEIENKLFQKVACNQPGCSSHFSTLVGLRLHQKNVHGIDHKKAEEEEPELNEDEDPVFNYGCVSLSYGLLLKNLGDAIKEGDGERVVRCWKYFTFIFKSTGQAHKNYALAGLRLIASLKGLLTPAKAHELTWNRSYNRNGGVGKCIPRDLRNEHLNKIAKEHIRSLGHSNISNENVIKLSRTIKCMEDIVRSFTEKEKHNNHNKNPHEETQLSHCISEISNANMFGYERGRKLNGFPNFKRTIYSGLEPITLKNWLVQYRQQWDIENKNNYRFDN